MARLPNLTFRFLRLLIAMIEFCFADSSAAQEVTLQRIEQGAKKSVPYSSKEIEISAAKDIEVR